MRKIRSKNREKNRDNCVGKLCVGVCCRQNLCACVYDMQACVREYVCVHSVLLTCLFLHINASYYFGDDTHLYLHLQCSWWHLLFTTRVFLIVMLAVAIGTGRPCCQSRVDGFRFRRLQYGSYHVSYFPYLELWIFKLVDFCVWSLVARHE